MDYEQFKTPEMTLEKIARAIEEAPMAIEAELERTGDPAKHHRPNTWFDCYSTRLAILSAMVTLAKEVLTKKDFDSMSVKLVKADEALKQAKSEQEDKFSPPSEELKRELLKKLDILDDKQTQS